MDTTGTTKLHKNKMLQAIINFFVNFFSKRTKSVTPSIDIPVKTAPIINTEPVKVPIVVVNTNTNLPVTEPIKAPETTNTPQSETPVKNYDNPKVKNAYPELPVVEYVKTTVSDIDTVNYILASSLPLNVKIATYAIFYIESGDGKHGINNNYEGIQADGSRLGAAWDSKVIATCVTPEMMTGKPRRFCVFNGWGDPLDYLASRVQARNLFLGGTTFKYSNLKITNADDWARAYYKEWVEGDAKVEPSASEKADILAVFNKANKAITK